MDLVPTPDQVLAAVSNVAQKLLYGGVADLRPMPRTLIDEGVLREVYHFRPAPDVPGNGDPVLLVTPLAAPASCYDLRRGCSLVEHLLQGGRPAYLVEYGEVSFKNRTLGVEHWVDEVVPAAVRAVSAHAGDRPVHLVGWSLGGLFSLLTAADRPDLPIASVTSLGVPVDVKQVPMVAPTRPLFDLPRLPGLVTRTYQALGAVPPLVGWAFQLASVQKLVTKPLAIGVNLDDAEFLAQLEAVDRFSAGMLAYPGRSFGQLYHRFVKGAALMAGRLPLGDRAVSLADVRVPVLVVAGATDGIAPAGAVKAVMPLLTGSPETLFEIVPGGHLGMLTGRAARETTWSVLDEWFDRWSGVGTAPKPAPKRAAAKRAAKPAKRTGARRTAAKKSATAATPEAAAKKSAAKKSARPAGSGAMPPPTADTIGTNPRRRYGSDGSRSLAR
jgi:polyhydroxyalkanoate synthase subunit PhaC